MEQNPGQLEAEQLIKNFEGLSLRSYKKDNDRWTIGWGNTFWENGKAVLPSDLAITTERAESLFDFWIDKTYNAVQKEIPNASFNQLAAYTSLAYNIGIEAFINSTSLKNFKANDLKLAAQTLEWFNQAGGHVLKGLQRRRRAESLVLNGMAVPEAIQKGIEAFA